MNPRYVYFTLAAAVAIVVLTDRWIIDWLDGHAPQLFILGFPLIVISGLCYILGVRRGKRLGMQECTGWLYAGGQTIGRRC